MIPDTRPLNDPRRDPPASGDELAFVRTVPRAMWSADQVATYNRRVFVEDTGLERALVVREHAPDAYAQVPTDVRSAVEHYAELRQKARAAGRIVEDPSPVLVADVKEAAARLRDLPPARDVSPRHRARFGEIVRQGSFADVVAAYDAWLAAIAAEAAAESARNDARARLGIPVGSGAGGSRPIFLVELGRAVGGPQLVGR